MKKVLFSVLSLCCITATSFAQPATNPDALPALTPAQVISVYTDNFYSDLTSVNFNPNWGQSGFASATTFSLNGNQMRYYPNMNYQGIDLIRPIQDQPPVRPALNVSSLETLQLDVWSSNCTSLDIYLVTLDDGERLINRTLVLNTWNRIQIPLSAYAALGIPLTAIQQFKFVTNTPGSGANIYMDNIFFYTTQTLPTLSNFSIPSKFIGDAPFAITPPTSNSAGAFSYMSSNPNVATISGDIITIIGGGTSVITATQAAAPPYAAASITANFTVSVGPLNTPAPTPTKPANKVISLFSDSYPNVPVTTWRTDWSCPGCAVLDTVVNGNNIKKYSGIDFVGIELPPIDVTMADSVHISVWTPSAPTFALKLVNQGGGPANENIVSFRPQAGSHTYGPAPKQGEWNVYTIPLSLYATPNGALQLTNRDKFFQLLFVGDAPFINNVYYVDDIFFSSTNNVLPVKLSSFTAVKKDKAVVLSWQTATEINNRGFAVERSKDGKSWFEIEFVKAAAPNGLGSNYSTSDLNPSKGMNYYRLKLVDQNGTFTYSAVRVINLNNNGNISIYPNPARAKVNVVLGESTDKASYQIFDLNGKRVLSGMLNAINGNASIDVSALTLGSYLIRIEDGQTTSTTKLVLN